MKSKIVKAIGLLICLLATVINYSKPMQNLLKLETFLYYSNISETKEVYDCYDDTIVGINNRTVSVGFSTDETLNNDQTIDFTLLGIIPIKKINLVKKEKIRLLPSGQCIGISIQLDGLLVVGMSDVTTDTSGTSVKSPIKNAGIKIGDYIISANGIPTCDSETLSKICSTCKGKLIIEVNRNGNKFDYQVSPVYDKRTNSYKIGAWVREDTAGIGTLSYFDPQTSEFAALGHAVTDIDTGTLFSISSGKIRRCSVIDITKGLSGEPGELYGAFSSNSKQYGTINGNTEFGVFGEIKNDKDLFKLYPNGVDLAYPDEIHTGKATILCSVDGENIEEYTCSIIKKANQSSPSIKGLVIEITDEKLINKTGGIIQGMSGSPIIQDNKLVGIVTHVMINNPQRGYGVFAYWVYDNNGK